VQLAEWNATLLEWFFPRRPSERVYLRADDAELQKMNHVLALGLDDPVAGPHPGRPKGGATKPVTPMAEAAG
jgi:hypothetical protein